MSESIYNASYCKEKSFNAVLDPRPLVWSGEQKRGDDLAAHFAKCQIKKEWVRLIYVKNKCNEKETIEELGRDVVVRKEVEELYARMETCDGVKSASQRIDILLRGRNHPLGTLHLVPTDQLEFDFHWFSRKQAIKYLDELIFELKSDPRAVSGDIRIKLIVGRGDYPGSIRQTFLDWYPHNAVYSNLSLR
ncbi:hypothetical protein L5515_009256 [Caenorhabditis briggsae]|uniref:Uncharacterized protein n=1 Tax=Caenorhabditis briggsae TaxID=6238 RepID=A0AAE9JMS3_CAEBR|nr:hypothetical protein L5515_009256 [Caenorhabditis briggsae]